jgi:tRNA-dihydrouridine synthase A
MPGARAYRRHLSQHAHKNDATPEVYQEALALLTRHTVGYAGATTQGGQP